MHELRNAIAISVALLALIGVAVYVPPWPVAHRRAALPPREVGRIVQVKNLTASGAIGAASLVTDARVVMLAQSTAGLVLTLPSPGDTSVVTGLDIVNAGSASFTMYGVAVPAGSLLRVAWTGAAWVPDATASSAVSPKTLQAGNSGTTASDGTFTLAFGTAFTNAPAVSLGVVSGGATAPQVTVCQVDAVSTTQVTGHCSSTQTSTVGALGATIAPVAAAANVVVGVLALARTQ